MRWQGGRQSSNVQDRRRMSPGVAVGGGGIVTLLIVLVAVLLGADPRALLQVGVPPGGSPGGASSAPSGGVGGHSGDGSVDPAEEELAAFMRVVLASTEDVWQELFSQQGEQYQDPTLVLFSGNVRSACGLADAAVGPFYCPGDSMVYLDLSFFAELDKKFGAPGDFAQAYVVAHEVGHHVQNLLGINEEVRRAQRGASKAEANALSVRLELQADYFAGVWAHHANKQRKWLEPGDLEEALRAASAIGDDRIQMAGRGYVVPDSFTHGTSAQRLKWFRKGFESGKMSDGNTFEAGEL